MRKPALLLTTLTGTVAGAFLLVGTATGYRGDLPGSPTPPAVTVTPTATVGPRPTVIATATVPATGTPCPPREFPYCP